MSAEGFPAAARSDASRDSQLRRNIGKATSTIRAKRAGVVAELPDWEALREAGSAIKARAMATLPEQLEPSRPPSRRAAGRRALGARRRGGERDRGRASPTTTARAR